MFGSLELQHFMTNAHRHSCCVFLQVGWGEGSHQDTPHKHTPWNRRCHLALFFPIPLNIGPHHTHRVDLEMHGESQHTVTELPVQGLAKCRLVCKISKTTWILRSLTINLLSNEGRLSIIEVKILQSRLCLNIFQL